MNQIYLDTARLLTQVTPFVLVGDNRHEQPIGGAVHGGRGPGPQLVGAARLGS